MPNRYFTNASARFSNTINPDCDNIHKALGSNLLILLVLTLVTVVTYIAVALYNYYKKIEKPSSTATADEIKEFDKKVARKQLIVNIGMAIAIVTGLMSVGFAVLARANVTKLLSCPAPSNPT